jgi:hypothetical protein
MEKNNIIEFRSGYFRLITEEVEGKIENKALVEATITQNNEYDSNSRYYYIPKYAVALGQNAQGETVPILYFVHNGELISFIKAIEDENDPKQLYTPLEVEFIPFAENTYYIPYPEDSTV